MSDNEATYVTNATLNPLRWFQVELAAETEEVPTDSLLGFLAWPGASHDQQSFKKRYMELQEESAALSAAPAEANILNRIVYPLRQARASYVLGNFLGTIALVGSVPEMLAVLLYQITDVSLAGRPLDPTRQRLLFGVRV